MSITLDGSNVSTVGVINSATAQNTTSGTSIDFTGIPAGVKRITVMFQGVSTNSTSVPLIQIGSGSVQATGYLGAGFGAASGGSPGITNFTTGFGLGADTRATDVIHGIVTITLLTGNTWTASGWLAQSDTTRSLATAGSVSLGGTLDRIRLTTVAGTAAFDAGSVNIFYE